MPIGFYTAGDMRESFYPEELYEVIDVYSFFETKTIQLNESGGSEWWLDSTFYIMDIDIGNWDSDFYYKDANETGLSCRLVHLYPWWEFWNPDHSLEWYDNSGVLQSDPSGYLTVEDIETNRNLDNVTSTWRASCGDFTYHANFFYNGTTYNNYTHAWNFHGLYVFFGVNFDDVNTSYNAWNIVAMLLFFQMPTGNPITDPLLSIILWITIGYLIYVLIIKVIPLIAGG